MNATTLVLTGASSANALDCSHPETVEIALGEFDRAIDAGDDAAVATWARRWGRNLLTVALEPKWEFD